jgi:GNAT superfamily N-acetyltransferase
MNYLTIPLDSSYNKNSFSCGKIALDDYLHKQANQDIKRKLSICFILPDKNNNIKGYYTLSNDIIPQEDLPVEIKKKMPKSYTNLPTTLLGRLAVDKNFRGQGIGELLLLDALKRCYDVSNESIGSMAVVVDPLDEDAVSFYKKYGFVELPDSGRMFLPMKTISELFK